MPKKKKEWFYKLCPCGCKKAMIEGLQPCQCSSMEQKEARKIIKLLNEGRHHSLLKTTLMEIVADCIIRSKSDRYIIKMIQKKAEDALLLIKGIKVNGK